MRTASFLKDESKGLKKKIIVVLALALGAYGIYETNPGLLKPAARQQAPGLAEAALMSAYNDRRSDVQVQAWGVVAQVLSDDREGSRHQRFILSLSTGQSVLVAHNIDLAPRIPALRKGDEVRFFGEYEWNEKGGVIHWTHKDPAGRHVGGWLKHKGVTYQ